MYFDNYFFYYQFRVAIITLNVEYVISYMPTNGPIGQPK